MHWLPADRNLRARKDDATTTCTEIAGTTDLRVESIYDFVRSSEVSYLAAHDHHHGGLPGLAAHKAAAVKNVACFRDFKTPLGRALGG